MDEENKIQRYEPAPGAMERRRAGTLAPYETLDVEETPELLTYLRMIRKRRWTVLTIFSLVVAVVLVGTLRQTPIYRAKALIEIEKENPNILTAQELFELQAVSDTYLETQYKILQSESLALRVIESLRLDQAEEFAPRKSWWASGESQAEVPSTQTFAVGDAALPQQTKDKERMLAVFRKRRLVQPIRRSRLVELSFDSKDPVLAAQVANTLASTYIEQNLEARWEATQKASEWISEQLLGLKARLEKSEEELQRYAHQQGLLFLQSAEGPNENIVNDRLRRLQEELTKAQADRYARESLYSLIENSEYASLPGVFENKLLQDLTVRLADLKREYAQLATTFNPDYPRVKQLQSQIDEVEAVLELERKRAAQRIVNEYNAAVERENLLRKAFALQQEQANLIAERSVQYNILKREVDTNKQMYEGLLQRLKEAGVSAGLKASNIRIVDPANPPLQPAKPRLLLNMALAITLGLGLGIFAAFLQEHLDNTVKTSEDVERFLRLPALALIPSIDSLNGNRSVLQELVSKGKLLTGGAKSPSVALTPAGGSGTPRWYRVDAKTGPHTALSEAFSSLRTSVLLSAAGRPPRTLLVTSSQPGEGKTTVSVNLSISLAQLGQRVLVLEGDLRRPCIHKAFGVKDASKGLVNYLAGQLDWQAVVQPTGVPGLDAIVSGPIPPNPAELLSSERMRALAREAAMEYDFVVCDSPPVLNVADSRILASVVEGVILVVKAGSTPRELVQRTQLLTQDVGGHLIGIVLNHLNVRAHDYYYYQYYRYDYYGPSDESSDRTS